MLKRVFPFLSWFADYKLSTLRMDFVAGLSVALVLVPQSMAYAQLAGLPVYYGLYASFLPPLIAVLFGSSNQLATGPVAVVSLMTATALEPLAIQGSEAYIAYAILLALIVGVFQFALGVMRLGIVVNFLSHPVVIGFTNAAAIIIATSQLSKIFGVNVENGEYHFQTILNVIYAARSYTHWPTLFMAILSISIMLLLKRVSPKIPNVLIAVSITTFLSWFLAFEQNIHIPLSSIQSEKFVEVVNSYNAAIEEVENKSKERTELTPQIQQIKQGKPVCQFCHNSSVLAPLSKKQEKEHLQYSAERLIQMQHQKELISASIHEWKEKSKLYRSMLHQYRFIESNVNSPHNAFTLHSKLEPSLSGTGRSLWRLQIGNKKMRTDEICLIGGGTVVGSIPPGLPKIQWPYIDISIIVQLFAVAVIISLLGFMEAISIAKAMATRTGQHLDPNQELIGQGLANIIGSFGQSYPVSGSFSRSAVNIQTGAQTGLSSVITCGIVTIVLLYCTPLLYYLPHAVLASIIMMAVIGLINFSGIAHAWLTRQSDGVIAIITFLLTLLYAPHLEKGIFVGVILSLGIALHRHMRPKLALVSKHPDGSYRNSTRWSLQRCRYIAALRFHGSLFFANASYLEDKILEAINSMPDLKHILLVGNAINDLDSTGEEMLSSLINRLHEAGYEISCSGLNDEIIDVMKKTQLYDKLGDDHMFRDVQGALKTIHPKTHCSSVETTCPLLDPCFLSEVEGANSSFKRNKHSSKRQL